MSFTESEPPQPLDQSLSLLLHDEGVYVVNSEIATHPDDETSFLDTKIAKLAELMIVAASNDHEQSHSHEDIEIGLRHMDTPLSPYVLRKFLDQSVEMGWLQKIKKGNRLSWQLSDGLHVEEARTVVLATIEALSKPKPPERLPYYQQLARDVPTKETAEASKEFFQEPRSTLEFHKALRFITHTSQWIEKLLSNSSNGMTKVAELTEILATERALDFSQEASRELVNSLVEAGHFHFRSIDGIKYVSREPAISKEQRDAQISAKRNAELARITEIADQVQESLLRYLNTKEKHESEFKTAIAKNVGGLDIEDVNAVCQVLKSRGVVDYKVQAGRGSRRTRKGKTWMITSRGRGYLQQIDIQSGLTNSQKRDIGNSFRH